MNTLSFTFNTSSALLPGRFWSTTVGALLLCAGAVHAAEPQQPAAVRPLDMSLPHDANALQAWRKKQALERLNSKPYGSGYEARGLEGRNNNDADATLLPSPRTDDKDSVGDSQSGGGASGGGTGGSSSGGSGGSSSGGSGGGSSGGSGGSSSGGSGGRGGRGR